ncbi:TetR/AcrR family transcriptional regulator [Nocardia vermiculata]|uniref:TetR/AcrR family transcriptional regulator n=1 Tax=Nocardia vermiculata TaxID=257274 RepID=A0A846XU42_9NOCA|nr:TetR/AcrR family transcriptional regulator [Nocardia vermiculata]NKY50636.1 TetR/AcrR family transcriptional regulator [Nocardia vermiculata]
MNALSPERPMRADARRNYQRIVECAREVFAEYGPDAPADDIARRASVGTGTLYRHFPNRDALVEAVYRSSIEALAELAHELADTHTPLAALEQWFRAQVHYVMDKRSVAATLKAAMDHGSPTFTLCTKLIVDAAAAVLVPAQRAGLVRPELEPRDLVRLGHGLGVACDTAPAAAERLMTVALAGLRTPPER